MPKPGLLDELKWRGLLYQHTESVGDALAAGSVAIVPLAFYLARSPVWSSRAAERVPAHRLVRPRVLDEVGNALFYLERTFFDAIPDVEQQLAEALVAHYPGIRVPLESPIRLGSWVGSDQDGNPNANAAMLTETLRLQRRTLLTRYRERVRELARDLSQSTRLTQVSDELAASIRRDEAELADYAETLSPGTADEPYRRKLSFIWRRLGATLEGEPGAYGSAADLAADLDMLDASLRRHRGAAVADGDLLRLRRQVRAFGFIGARLDVRQHRAVIRAAGLEVVNRLGAASDRRRSATLNPPPISLDAGRWSPATGNLLATLGDEIREASLILLVTLTCQRNALWVGGASPMTIV